MANTGKRVRRVALAASALATARAVAQRTRRIDLRGKTVVIMGGTRGLGRDLARTFAARGARVALCARDPDEVERAREDLASRGAEVLGRVCDASVHADVEPFLRATIERFGAIDVLVTSAATIQIGPLEAMRREDYEQSLQAIFWTTYVPTMAVLPHMRQRGRGRIVHITSFGGKVAVPHMSPYSTAKFAATGFSQSVRAEVAKDGILVTTIAPGLIRTGAEVNVPFKGDREREYVWFTSGLVLPFISISSERAARAIVAATERGDAERMLSFGVRAVTVANAIAPGLVSRALAMQTRLLPKGRDPEPQKGADIAAHARSRLIRLLAFLGRPNAERHHELPGPVHVSAASVARQGG